MWHICSEFSLKCFSGEKRLGYRKNVCYRRYLSGAFGGVGNFVQYHFVSVCVRVCVNAEDVFLALIDVSLAEQVLQRFYERNLLSFMCLGRKKRRVKAKEGGCKRLFQKDKKKIETHQQLKEPLTLKQSD